MNLGEAAELGLDKRLDTRDAYRTLSTCSFCLSMVMTMTENTAPSFRSSQKWQRVPNPVSVFWLMFPLVPFWGEG